MILPIAFYLPQFHPVPENDAAWGIGFTEWTNTAKAKPLFRGHHQPNVPADLGFCDLRLPETREAQATLAVEHAIYGFCYYHYWFSGRMVLERPFQEVLRSGSPASPKFCLCWANETWTGIWHGAPGRVLIKQDYPGREDHEKHFGHLIQAFRDPRYIRIDDRPLFLIYRHWEIPGLDETIALWRKLARAYGLPDLYLVGFNRNDRHDPLRHDFDAAVYLRMKLKDWTGWRTPLEKIRRKHESVRGLPTVHEYSQAVAPLLPDPFPSRCFPCVVPNFDNTPRAGARGVVYRDSTPEKFRLHLRRAVEIASERRDVPKLLFLRSWNEWAEGNYLEPDLRHGRKYLEVVRDEVRER